jgi:serine/threonine-protein kinase
VPSRDDQPTFISRRPPLAPPSPASDSVARILQGKVLPGDRLEHFELIEYVGGGGMGRVYRALDTRLARSVALKVLPPEQAADEETRLRFQNEAQSAARLDHDNIARVFHVGSDRNLHYIVFEFVEGVNIRALVEQQGPLSLADAVNYTLQIAEALLHAAERDVVHRDIKPSNVLITPQQRVKLIDMGLARFKQADPAVADLTASGVTLGTFDYISPEQARDPRNADARSDLYSLGCTLFFMLTGRPPFPEGTVLQKLLQHQGDQPPDVRQFRPELPEEVARFLRKMMAKDPRHRYGSPAELVDELLGMAQRIGLQPLGRDGQIWAEPSAPKVSFLHRHLPWIAPVATLVGIVLLMDLFGSFEAQRDDRHATSASSEREATPAEAPMPEDYSPQMGNLDDFDFWPTDTAEPSSPAQPSPQASPQAIEPSAPDAEPIAPEPPGGAAQGASTGSGGVLVDGMRSSPLATPGSPSPSSTAGVIAQTTGDGIATGRAIPSELPYNTLRAWPIDGGTLPGFSLEAETPPFAGQFFAGPSSAAVRPAAATPAEQVLRHLVPLVVGDGAEGGNQFATLEAACSAAVNDDVIELRFNGLREERPIRLANLHLTIRAGEGYHPVLAFRPNEIDPVKYPHSMLTLAAGSLTLKHVSLELHVPREVPAESWSLLETRGGQTVRLESCWLSICNASDQLAAYHEDVAFFRAKTAPGLDAVMGQSAAAASPPANVELMDCVARGEAVFLKVEDLQPASLLWENGLLVTTERLLTADGGEELPKIGDMVQVTLRHVTAVVRSGLCRMTDSKSAPYQLPTEIRCADSIVLAVAGKPMIVQESVQAEETLRRRIAFSGDRNFYEGIDVFWTLDDFNPDTPPQSMDFDAWRAHWGPQRENLPSRAPLVWKKPPETSRPVHLHTPDDYTLSDSGKNPGLVAASDGRNVGCQPDRLPQLPPMPPAGGKADTAKNHLSAAAVAK